jgi:hypothetical protein
MKDQERWKRPKTFEEIRNIEGVVELKVEADQKQYFVNV